MPNYRALVVVVVMTLLAGRLAAQQSPTGAPGPGAIAKIDRDRALDILDVVSQNIHETYYDPKMNGLDCNAVVQKARDKIVESNSLNDAFIQIAIALRNGSRQ